ncbi:VPLPA-CTERM sorting domain-containing protein [Roseovarius sp. D22-M7]
MTAPAAHALTLDETQVEDVGFGPTELNATLNFDGYTGSGTVTEVRLGFRGVIESDISIFNISASPQDFSADTVTEFAYTSPAGPSVFDVAGGTGPTTIVGGGNTTFEVDGSNSSGLTVTGGGLAPFLSPFTVDLLTDTFIRISGGGGRVLGGQETEAFGEVTVEYFTDDPLAPIPLPASAFLMLAALGSFLALRRYKTV